MLGKKFVEVITDTVGTNIHFLAAKKARLAVFGFNGEGFEFLGESRVNFSKPGRNARGILKGQNNRTLFCPFVYTKGINFHTN